MLILPNDPASFEEARAHTQQMIAAPSRRLHERRVVCAIMLNQGSATVPATLYAFEGATGKEIWNSGKTRSSRRRARRSGRAAVRCTSSRATARCTRSDMRRTGIHRGDARAEVIHPER